MLYYKLVKYFFVTTTIVVLSLTKVYGESLSLSDTSAINTNLRSAKNALISNKVPESLRLSRFAFELSNKIGYTKGKAESLSLIAQIYAINGKKDSSILTYKKSLNLFIDTRNEFEVGSVLNRIGNAFKDIDNNDSAEYYYGKALKLRQKINDKKGVAGTISNLGILYSARGIYAKALEYNFLSLSISEEIGDRTTQSTTLNNIGVVFWNQGDYTKALEFFFKTLKIKEELNDLKGAGFIYNNIGLVYQQSDDYPMALKYHYESLKLKQTQGDKLGMSYSFLNLGDIYQEQGNYERALESYSKAEEFKKKLSDYASLASLYVNKGKLYRKMKNPIKSIEVLNEADKIYKSIDDPKGMASYLIQIGLTQFELGAKDKAITYCLLGINNAKQVGALELVKQGYESLARMYEETGKTVQAFSSYKMFIVFRDSLSSIEKSKEIYKIQMQAEFDKLMQKQKLEQDQNLALAQGKSRKQTTIANIFILAFAITLSVSILFFIDFRQKQRNNDILAFQRLDMERQKSELTFQRDELEIQKNLVIHQRDKIMTMLTDLGESIDYARKIQQALLPSDKALEILLGEYFLLFQPRESVGGDFYWVAQYEHLTFFAVGDCTGHGVPGGFMSMLGVSLLNELVSRSECASPARMLWSLREMIIKALNQTGLDEDSQDGMDIALCMYNPQNHHLVYSGSNLSLILATATPPPASEKVSVQGNIVELKPDRMPVAFYQRMDDFYEHHIVINPGDTIYLFSDGYSDQFGGPLNKKFGYTTFRNLLTKASILPFDKQKNLVWNEFDKWKGVENQTDDVIVMGIKLS